ncbi:hypothetical protein THRCLA_03054 [Thraustotheca clavata]|uniref:Nickel/cobalt efflux system n=1 Tax=Thraustotheca clavata TaxID=74557 RepID=A0A1W0A387_9STRA|nr:hypothetical protein THRCLA_03054 [Thraustotheca clavata]
MTPHGAGLGNASAGTLVGTGILFGIIHVLTGPDHLSALATLSAGSSWRSFALGVRWGLGHSIGLVIMALFFILLDGKLNLDELTIVTDVIVGLFMIALGGYGMYNGRKKYQEGQLEQIETKVSGNGKALTYEKCPDGDSGEESEIEIKEVHLEPIKSTESKEEEAQSSKTSPTVGDVDDELEELDLDAIEGSLQSQMEDQSLVNDRSSLPCVNNFV